MRTKVDKEITLVEGGATSPTVKLYRLKSGRCRVYSHYHDQDGAHSETLATFKAATWEAAVKKARTIVTDFLQ